jgi:hypothetical protein
MRLTVHGKNGDPAGLFWRLHRLIAVMRRRLLSAVGFSRQRFCRFCA